jgi:hypothetical protein
MRQAAYPPQVMKRKPSTKPGKGTPLSMILVSEFRWVMLIFMFAHAFACRARTEITSLERRFENFQRIEEEASGPDRARATRIGLAYDAAFTPEHEKGSLSSLNDGDLILLFRASQTAAFYTVDPRHIRHMRSVLGELQRRGRARASDNVKMYEILVKARMLTEARELGKQHPMPEALPEFREAEDVKADGPTELVVHPTKYELLRQNVALRDPIKVVVVSSPLCHFCKDAMRDIQADPQLRELFRAHAKWLAPQDGRFNLKIIQKWNREHPGQEITVAFRREEWPLIDYWGTPTFYFLEKGALKAKVQGWPKGGRRAELLAGFRQVGLLK